LAVSDTPDHNTGKLKYHPRGSFRARPVIAHDDFVTFGDQIQNLDM
jgi:hypothetical protein